MNLANLFISGSIVLVVTLFLVFLYQTNQINNHSKYNYDTDPSIIEANNTYKLLCPEGYYYDSTATDTDGELKDICKENDSDEELKFKTLKVRDKFVYPDEDHTNLTGISDRCKNLYDSRRSDKYSWNALTQFCDNSFL